MRKVRELKDFPEIDLSAPRVRKEVLDYRILIRESTEKMKSTYPELQKYKDSEISVMIIDFMELIMEEILNNHEGVWLPWGVFKMVSMSVVKNVKTDIATSRKLGKNITYSNLHTDGNVAKLFFSTRNPGDYKPRFTLEDRYRTERRLLLNGNFWRFIPSRKMARKMAVAFKADHKKFRVFTKTPYDNPDKLKRTYRRQAAVLKDYNGFEL